jgi:hypothetical protein
MLPNQAIASTPSAQPKSAPVMQACDTTSRITLGHEKEIRQANHVTAGQHQGVVDVQQASAMRIAALCTAYMTDVL